MTLADRARRLMFRRLNRIESRLQLRLREIQVMRSRLVAEELESIPPPAVDPTQLPTSNPPTTNIQVTEEFIDLDLLAKLAQGDGGNRTGALARAGLVVWQVTPRGVQALQAAVHARTHHWDPQ